MFNEMMQQLVEEFDQKQKALIDAIGDNLYEVLEGIAKTGMNFGKPPFIVEDGEIPLLLVGKDGQYVKLPPGFSLSDEIVEDGFDAVYTLPVLNFDMIRFIPVQQGANLPSPYQSPFCATAYSPEFLAGLSHYLKAMVDASQKFASLYMSKKLIQLQGAMQESAAAEGMDLESFMWQKEVRDAFISVLGDTFAEAAEKAKDTVLKVRDETTEEEDTN